MEVRNLRVEDSPRSPEFVRCSVEVDYQSRSLGTEIVWFEVPKELAGDVSRSGDPWLTALLPVAMVLNQPLVIRLPVDNLLLANTQKRIQIWCDWYPELSPIDIQASAGLESHPPEPMRTALFFSGGVDSFYTLIHSQESATERIDDLLLIHGFDIPVENGKAFESAREMASRVAVSFGKSLVPIATNMRQTRFQEANWGDLAFGCLLAGAGLILAGRYSRILISSGLSPDHLRPHASHPDTDRLFSTRQTTFQQYAIEMDRIPKIEYLSGHPIALRNLRVCVESDAGVNCGHCLKCVSVMSTLEVMGALENSPAFPGGALDLDRLRTTYLSEGLITFGQIRGYAVEKGRLDIADAVDQAFRRTRNLDRWLLLGWIRKARERFRHDTTVRRATRRLRPWLFRSGRWLNRLVP